MEGARRLPGRRRGPVTERRFDAVRFEGPGTDLTVGLLPTTLFMAARFETVDGIVHMPNLPSEEIFGAPDPQRTEGVVRATKPLVIGGTIIRASRSSSTRGAPCASMPRRAPRSCAATPPATRAPRASARSRSSTATGASASSRRSSSTRCSMRTPPPTSRSAGYRFTAGEEDHPRLNHSSIHVDFMIGGDDVAVTGVTTAGDRRARPARRRLATLSRRSRAPVPARPTSGSARHRQLPLERCRSG